MHIPIETQAPADFGRGHMPVIPPHPPGNETEYQYQVADLTFLVEHAATNRQGIVDAFAAAISARQRGFPQIETGAAA